MFTCGQVVKLREARTDVQPGEPGRVLGRYTDDRTLLVAFARVTIRVAPERVTAADGRRGVVAA